MMENLKSFVTMKSYNLSRESFFILDVKNWDFLFLNLTDWTYWTFVESAIKLFISIMSMGLILIRYKIVIAIFNCSIKMHLWECWICTISTADENFMQKIICTIQTTGM
jgi:hypothetical protein